MYIYFVTSNFICTAEYSSSSSIDGFYFWFSEFIALINQPILRGGKHLSGAKFCSMEDRWPSFYANKQMLSVLIVWHILSINNYEVVHFTRTHCDRDYIYTTVYIITISLTGRNSLILLICRPNSFKPCISIKFNLFFFYIPI